MSKLIKIESSSNDGAGDKINFPDNIILIQQPQESENVHIAEVTNDEPLIGFEIRSKIKTLELDRICRVCLSAKPQLQSIFDEIGLDTIAGMLMSFASVQLAFGNGLAEYVCNQCTALIEQCFIFKQQCKRSEQIWRNLIEETQSHQLSETKLKILEPLEDVKKDTHFENFSCDDSQPTEQLDCPTNDNESTDSSCLKENSSIMHPRSSVRLKMHQHKEKENLETYGSQTDKPVTILETENCKQSSQVADGCNNLKKNIQLTCELCSKVFPDNRKFSRHKKTHIKDKPHLCSICKKSFHQAGTFQRHMARHEANKSSQYPFPCSKCHLGFTSEGDLHIHSAVHSEDDVLTCYHCEKSFSKRIQLKRHVRTHLIDKPYKCDVCCKGFPEKSSLTRHYRKHNGQPLPKTNICSVCGKAYSFRNQLQVHMRSHTGERPCVCAVCGNRFADIRLLNSHMRLHSDEKPYSCNFCVKKFRHEQTLVCHIRVHTGEKPFECKLCDKRFKQSSNLSLHLKRHRGEKPFGCEVCGKRFTSSSTLRTHSRVHTGEKPYQCRICEKRFARFNMAIHMRTHTGEKPYSCQLCTRKFSTQTQLNKHSKIHLRNKPCTCPICGKGWLVQSHLKKHLSTSQTCCKPYKSKDTERQKKSSAKRTPATETNAVPITSPASVNDLLKHKVSFISAETGEQITAVQLKDSASEERLVEMAQVINVADLPEGTFNIVTVTTEGEELNVTYGCQQLQSSLIDETGGSKIFQFSSGFVAVGNTQIG